MKRMDMCVAVVDDSKAMLVTISSTLKKLGVGVVKTFDNARTALDDINQNQRLFHVFLLISICLIWMAWH